MNWFLNQLPLESKIAFCFSDPAGANACIALAAMIDVAGYEKPILFSNSDYKGAIEHSFIISKVQEVPDWDSLDVDMIFTGTSHPDSSHNFEVRCIRRAKELRKPVISFIDHWINFSLRFGDLPIEFLPDSIWVIDEGARKLALAEGLPAEKVVISGNPYQYYLKNIWKSSFTGKQYLNTIGIGSYSKYLLFAPDPISLRLGKQQVGFTEYEVVEELISYVSTVDKDAVLIIKLHPLQPLPEFERLAETITTKVILLKQAVNLPELLKAVDLVIGFYSNVLLDAMAVGTKVIRYFPGKEEYDLLNQATIVVPAISRWEDLKSALKKSI
ncbi:MAG TPA: hypothetical protein VHK91_12210 [Flavisolibacter sp.]|jgi:hypothetical protein|nr:hypothetical protein [Flavisolibacter sp.]